MISTLKAGDATSWFSSGPIHVVRQPISIPKAKPKKLPSLAALKKRIAEHEKVAAVKAEENAARLIGRKHI